MEKGKLTIDLSNVQLPANLITTQRTWHTIPYTLTETTNIDPETGLEYTDEMHGVHFHSDNKLASSYTNLLEVIGGNIWARYFVTCISIKMEILRHFMLPCLK